MGQPAAELAPPAPSQKPAFLRQRLFPALVTAGLMYVCFFPLNWGWLGWVALVPLVAITVAPDRRGIKLAAWLAGLLFFLAATQWVRLANEVMYAGWVLLSLLISLHFPVFVSLTRLLTLRVGVPLVLAAPTTWTALEYVRAHINVGFAWYYMGHTQHELLPIVQIADVFGAYGVSFLVVMVNVAVFEFGRWAYQRKMRLGQVRFPVLACGLAAGMLAVTLGYGFVRLGQDEFKPGPKLALIQGNLPQFIRNEPGEEVRVAEHFENLAATAAKLEPDLIVWSETSWPVLFCYVDEGVDRSTLSGEWSSNEFWTRDKLTYLRDRFQRPMLVGLNGCVLEPDGEKHYNSAILIDAAGKLIDRYDKIERVPFGEYIPYQDYVPILKWLSPYEEENDYGIAAGRKLTVFPFQGYRFAVLICYEDSVPHLAPRFLRQEERADFFVNISNDGWFHGSEEHEQHLVSARFRAIETRRAVARAVNMGISCLIDSNGRLLAMPGPTWAQSKSCTAVVTGQIPIDSRASLYVWWGDVLPWACLAVCLAGVVAVLVRRVLRRAPAAS
jgi:apolipoprotein N-acyltransferase